MEVAFREHKATNKDQIGELTSRLDQAFTEKKEMWQIGKSLNAEWQSKMSNQLRDDAARCKGEAELSAQTASSKQMDLITTVISIATEESTPVGLAVAAKDGASGEQFGLTVATTSRTATTESRQVS